MALAYHQLGRPDEAGKWLARAKAWAERPEGRGTALLGWEGALIAVPVLYRSNVSTREFDCCVSVYLTG